MFSSSKKAAAKAPESDDYDDEQHLVAAVSEFKKVESATQTMVDQLYQRLASPFQITTKPCEANRAAVLQCYQQLSGASAKSSEGGDGASSPSPSTDDAWLSVSYQQCYEQAMAYNQCVEKDTLAKHLALVAAFEFRGAQQKMVHQAAEKAQQQQQQYMKETS